jgi:hypothetical protein
MYKNVDESIKTVTDDLYIYILKESKYERGKKSISIREQLRPSFQDQVHRMLEECLSS